MGSITNIFGSKHCLNLKRKGWWWWYLEVLQAGQEATSTHKPVTKYPENISEVGYKCVCLNAWSIVNKKTELNIVVEHIDPHIIGITESWAQHRHNRC